MGRAKDGSRRDDVIARLQKCCHTGKDSRHPGSRCKAIFCTLHLTDLVDEFVCIWIAVTGINTTVLLSIKSITHHLCGGEYKTGSEIHRYAMLPIMGSDRLTTDGLRLELLLFTHLVLGLKKITRHTTHAM